MRAGVGSNEDDERDRLDSDPGVGPEISELVGVSDDVGPVDKLCEVEDGNREETIGWSTKGSLGMLLERAYRMFLSAVGREG